MKALFLDKNRKKMPLTDKKLLRIEKATNDERILQREKIFYAMIGQ